MNALHIAILIVAGLALLYFVIGKVAP